jgi:ELWxxDGT repeat protein
MLVAVALGAVLAAGVIGNVPARAAYPKGSTPHQLLRVGNKVFFVANDGLHGYELWVTNGTAAGTHMVKDIHHGSSSSSVYAMTAVGKALFFGANDGNGPGLWKSDGSKTGTTRVSDTAPIKYSYPYGDPVVFTAVIGSTLFFAADDGQHGPELWRSDGSSDGTSMVADINEGAAGSYPSHLTSIGGVLYFTADDGQHGFEPWASDGTEEGTAILADIHPGSEGSGPPTLDDTWLLLAGPRRFVRAFSMVVFGASDGSSGMELWGTEGPGSPVTMLKDIDSGPDDSYPAELTPFGTDVVFRADDGIHGSELWETDGTEGGTAMVKNIRPGSAGSHPSSFVKLGRKVVFTAILSEFGRELWRTNGTSGETVLVRDIDPGMHGSRPTDLTRLRSWGVVFQAFDPDHWHELWRTSGWPGGTHLLKDVCAGLCNGYPEEMTPIGDGAVFRADDGVHGVELWITEDGTSDSTHLLKDINPT